MSTGSGRDSYDEALVLLLLHLCGRMGRRQMSRLLELGEGRVRRVVERLRSLGLVTVKPGGVAISEEGRRRLYAYLSEIGVSEVCLVDAGELGEGLVGFCCLMRGRELREVVEVRDEAVREGAQGALVLRAGGGALFIPPLGRMSDHLPRLARELGEKIRVGDGDALIVAYARGLSRALRGGLRAAAYANRVFGKRLS